MLAPPPPTASWGPAAWHFLNSVALAYPEDATAEQREAYRQFFMSLQHVLPCGRCAANHAQHNKKLILKKL